MRKTTTPRQIHWKFRKEVPKAAFDEKIYFSLRAPIMFIYVHVKSVEVFGRNFFSLPASVFYMRIACVLYSLNVANVRDAKISSRKGGKVRGARTDWSLNLIRVTFDARLSFGAIGNNKILNGNFEQKLCKYIINKVTQTTTLERFVFICERILLLCTICMCMVLGQFLREIANFYQTKTLWNIRLPFRMDKNHFLIGRNRKSNLWKFQQ